MKLNPKLLLDVMYPVGSYYETSNASFNPNTAWGGTWIREDDGTALVSYKSSGAFNQDIGTIVGEETHTLTVDEMPVHNHSIKWTNEGGVGSGYGTLMRNEDMSSNYRYNTENKGGGQAHNNVQPSKVVYRWHRTA